MGDLILRAPLQGWVAPLAETPDAVFADRMLGDGVAIDPSGATLYAPCAGEVVTLPASRHALVLRAACGAEILMHIGLETAAMGGEGFEAHVAPGQRVELGDRLISFDLETAARAARSLISPIIVANGDAFLITRREEGCEIEVGQFLMALSARTAEPAAPVAAELNRSARFVEFPLTHGLHARPAAILAAEAKRYAADIRLTLGDRTANAKSPVALMALGVGFNARVEVAAVGSEAEAAVDAIVRLLATGLGGSGAPASAGRRAPSASAKAAAARQDALTGVGVAGGLAIGVAAKLTSTEVVINPTSRGAAVELAAFDQARSAVKSALAQTASATPAQLRPILEAHLALLDDAEMTAQAQEHIREGRSAATAWSSVIEFHRRRLEGLSDPRLAGRAADLADLERQVLLALQGETDAVAALPEHAIVVGDDILPSRLIALDRTRLAGLCLARGGPTSHVSILAAGMNLPTLVALGPRVKEIAEGDPLIVDAEAGVLTIKPDATALESAMAGLDVQRRHATAAQSDARLEARTRDGVRIKAVANLGSLEDAITAVANGAEGCGLLRTEFLFLDRETAPSGDEQTAAYQAIADALGGLPLTIRTLDVGGDKPVAYLPIGPEANPALGLRGVRVGLWRPDLLRTQLAAILRVSAEGLKIMAPMISSVEEFEAVRAMAEAAAAELGVRLPPLGAMIETPAAAMTTDLMCRTAAFISVGTNDLAQYALAMDRGHSSLAEQIDGLHPAVLRLIAQATAGAKALGRPVSVCGGLASDLVAAPILVGLGVTELSTSGNATPALKALIRTLDSVECARLAQQAMRETSADAVRRLVRGRGDR